MKKLLVALYKEMEKKKMKENIIIRLERENEYHEVENLVRESFWNVYRPGCLEHYVLHKLRNDPAFVPELDFVMTLDGQLIGQNMFMKAVIAADDGRSIPIMTMGPICIAPELKRKQRHLIESSCIWRRKNFWDRFLNDEKQEVNLDESNGKRLVSEKLDAGYSEYVMGRRHQQTSRFSNQAVTFKRNGKNT